VMSSASTNDAGPDPSASSQYDGASSSPWAAQALQPPGSGAAQPEPGASLAGADGIEDAAGLLGLFAARQSSPRPQVASQTNASSDLSPTSAGEDPNSPETMVVFDCRHPGCGKTFHSSDAVRKHARKQHVNWLRRIDEEASLTRLMHRTEQYSAKRVVLRSEHEASQACARPPLPPRPSHPLIAALLFAALRRDVRLGRRGPNAVAACASGTPAARAATAAEPGARAPLAARGAAGSRREEARRCPVEARGVRRHHSAQPQEAGNQAVRAPVAGGSAGVQFLLFRLAAPSACVVAPRAQAAPTHPRAPPQHLRGSPQAVPR
jgi:hypothetical protein